MKEIGKMKKQWRGRNGRWVGRSDDIGRQKEKQNKIGNGDFM